MERDSVFHEAEKLAAERRQSRRQLYTEALREYLARHNFDELPWEMNRVYAGAAGQADEFVSRAVQESAEW